MDLSIRDHWEDVVTEAVKSGRFSSPEEVVHEGLRLVAERELKLTAVRERIEASINDPRPSLTDEEVGEALRLRATTYSSPGEHA